MELKLSKVYVPVNPIDNNSLILKTWIDETEDYVKEQELYTFTKEELERVIGDAWFKGWDNCDGASKINLEQYLNSILK